MADDPFQNALDQIASLDAASNRLKRWVNDGDILAGREARFKDVGDGATFVMEGVTKPKGRQFSPGQFFNKPFAGAVKLILLGRYEAAGNAPSPASVDEIHESMMQGSFNFETAGADNQKNSIRISLGKNSTTFVRLPNSDLFGLVEWYGKRSKPGRKASGSGVPASGAGGTEDDLADNGDEDHAIGDDAQAETADSEALVRRI